MESQLADRDARSTPGPRLSAGEIERKKKRESLELSRRRVGKELETSRSPVHRSALEHALVHLDGELRKLAEGETSTDPGTDLI